MFSAVAICESQVPQISTWPDSNAATACAPTPVSTIVKSVFGSRPASAIMPLAAPIGSGLGILNKVNIKIIRSQTKIPLIIDAGLGQASDATIAMELGCDGVLVNTAIAKAKKPFDMALAFKNAVVSGRQSFLAGRIEKNLMGNPSSPLEGII